MGQGYLAAAMSAPVGGGGPVGPEPWKTVTDAQLRAWRGDFFGIYLPELVLDECPDTRNGIKCGLPGVERGCLFTQHYLNYTASQKAAIRSAYKARGYTHFPFNCTDTPGMYGYSGTYPPCPSDNREILNGALKELWWDGLIPCCIVIGYHDVDTDEALQQFLDLLDDPLLVRIVWPGMEMNQGASREQIAQRIQRFNRMMPWALQYIQFSPGHSAGDTPEAEWWKNGWNTGDTFLMENDTYEKVMEYDWPGAQNIENLIGFLLNDDHFHDPNAMIEDCGAMLVRLQKNGYRWNLGRSFDVIACELYALEHAHQGPGEDAGVTHCNKLLDVAYYQEYENYAGYKGTLAGFVNGGTIR
jgi:hypothetical protein